MNNDPTSCPILGCLLEGPCEMRYFTDVRLVFRALGDHQRRLNWLVTDLEWVRLDQREDTADEFSRPGPHWVPGDDLTRFVDSYDIQFVWAVFSGFPPGVSLDLSDLEVEPNADGNSRLWDPEPRIQHPLAEVEIVCWDSTCTLLLCRDPSLVASFRRYFPEAVDLAEHNRRLLPRG